MYVGAIDDGSPSISAPGSLSILGVEAVDGFAKVSLEDFVLEADDGHNVIQMTLTLAAEGGVTFTGDLTVESQAVPGEILDQMILPLDLIDCLSTGCTQIRIRAAPAIIEEFMVNLQFLVPVSSESDAYIDIEVDGTAQINPNAVHRIIFGDFDVSRSDDSSRAAGILASLITIVIAAVIAVAVYKFRNRENEPTPEKEELSGDIPVVGASI